MNARLGLALGPVLSLIACAGSAVLKDPPERIMTVGADAYVISQITASTWSATGSGQATELSAASPGRLALLSEIERLSGCKVTHSDYSRQSRQLDAQVDCVGQLKN